MKQSCSTGPSAHSPCDTEPGGTHRFSSGSFHIGQGNTPPALLCKRHATRMAYFYWWNFHYCPLCGLEAAYNPHGLKLITTMLTK